MLEVPTRWMVVFDDAVEALRWMPRQPMPSADPYSPLPPHIDQHKEIVRTAYQILEQSPTLQQSGLVTTTWLLRIADIFKRFSTDIPILEGRVLPGTPWVG